MKNFKICPKLNYSKESKEIQLKVDTVIHNIRQKMLAAGYVEANNKDKKIDWVFSIGGDGTMLHTMRSHVYKGSVVVGVNAGNVGFLTPYSLEDILSSDILSLLNGDIRVEKRSILSHVINSDKGYAVNDYAITALEQNDMLDFSIEIEHHNLLSKAGTYRANALVVSGPCGSTAYNMNAGGAVIDPVVKCMQMVMIAPTTLGTRPLIISKNSKIHVKLKSDAKIFADGILINTISASDTVFTVSLMQRESNILVPEDWNFFNILAKKLHWNNGREV
jgi:NAD+ kinase